MFSLFLGYSLQGFFGFTLGAPWPALNFPPPGTDSDRLSCVMRARSSPSSCSFARYHAGAFGTVTRMQKEKDTSR